MEKMTNSQKMACFKPKIAILILMACMFVLPIISSATITDNIIHYWKLNDGNGTTASDSLNRANGVMLNGNPYNVTGKLKDAFNFTNGAINYTNTYTKALNRNWTLNLWIFGNGTADASYAEYFTTGDASSNGGWALTGGNPGQNTLLLTKPGVAEIGCSITYNNNSWNMITVVYQTNNSITLYKNGTAFCTANDNTQTFSSASSIGHIGGATAQKPNARIDEVGIWNRSLNITEIQTLYNSSNGYEFTFLEISAINSPTDNSLHLPGENITFNVTAIDDATFPIINATLYVNNTISIVNTSIHPIIYIGPFIPYDIVMPKNFTSLSNNTWFMQVCWSDGSCRNSTTRYFNVTNIILNSVTYNSTTQIGTEESYKLNVSHTLEISSANFTYNNIIYSPSITTSATNSLISFTFSPNSIGTKSFNWTILFSDGTIYRTTNYSQIVTGFGIDDCSTFTNKLLNLTLLDEENQTIIANASTTKIEVDINIYPKSLYPNSPIISFNKTYNNNNATVCINDSLLIGSEYYMDAQIRYSSANHVSELYNIQKYSLTNSTAQQNISLYELATLSNTNFLITIKDSSFLPLKKALIMIQRKYVGEGVYKNVEIPLSDKDGQAVGHFDLNSVIYQIVIVKNGVTLATFSDITPVCTDTITGQCYLNLNQVSGSQGFDDYTNFADINYVLTTNTTGSSILTFNTIDGTSTLMNITSISYGLNPVVLCSASLLSSAGTLTCNMPSTFTNGTFEINLYKGGVLVTREIYSLSLPASSRFGNEGYIYLLLLIITIPFMFITDTIGFMVAIAIGFIIGSVLFLYSSGSILGKGSALIWLIVAIGIIIYKLSERKREM